jgi:hypothetical protein
MGGGLVVRAVCAAGGIAPSAAVDRRRRVLDLETVSDPTANPSVWRLKVN